MADYLALPGTGNLLKLHPTYFQEPKPPTPKTPTGINPTCPCSQPGTTTFTPLDGTGTYKICAQCQQN